MYQHKQIQRKQSLGSTHIAPSKAPWFQAKLTIGAPNDIYEQEAERVADQIMRMPDPSAAIQRAPIGIQRCARCASATRIEDMCPSCAAKAREEAHVQRAATGAVPDVTPQIEARINALRGGGHPLDTSVRAFMEPRFGHDFGQVRVHTGAQAARSAADVGALAYTVGRDVVFGAGQYQPGTDAGKRLIAHELTHVVQQGTIRKILQRDEANSTALSNSQTNVAGGTSNSVLDKIAELRRPMDVGNWWGEQRQNPQAWSHSLTKEEQDYMEVFTSPDAPTHIGRGIARPDNLNNEEIRNAKRTFGEGEEGLQMFSNFENRRRIIAHYIHTHPAMIAYEMQLYRLTRDANPPLFIIERIMRLFRGRETFTDEQVSRVHAAVDLVIPFIVGRALGLARPATAPSSTSRPLDTPIWDLPQEGGGIVINGRWYTEHALERMAPDTPQVRAELASRARTRLDRLGIRPDSEVYDMALRRAMEKIDPRGVPPSVVEAEIARRGSTNVTVITARGGRIVVTVIPRTSRSR